jgi:hypothetical protein
MGNQHQVHLVDGYGDDAQRPCARGERCATRDYNKQPAFGPRALCSTDRDFLVRAIEQLPEMYLELYMTLGEKGAAGEDTPRVSGGGKTAPIPIRADVDALMRRIIDVLSSWDERVRTVARLAGPDTEEARRRRAGVAMSTMCRTLTAHVDVLLALEPEPMMRDMDLAGHTRLPEDAVGVVHTSGDWISYQTSLGGGDAAQEAFALHAACRSKLGYTRKSVLLRSRCWDCDASGKLVRADGAAGLDDHVSCRACRAEYVGERLVELMAAEERLVREIAAGRKAS